jgi:hypothetical protein
MSSHIASQCLSVAEFFAGINWHGLEAAPARSNLKVSRAVTSSAKKKLDLTSPQAMCLSVGEFFKSVNWQGETIDYIEYTESDSEAIDGELQETTVFSFTLPVKEFFALVAWDGQSPQISLQTEPSIKIPVKLPEIQPEPAKKAKFDLSTFDKLVSPPDNTDLNVNDLSNLF